MIREVEVQRLILDSRCQQRVSIPIGYVGELAAVLERGDKFRDPIVVYEDVNGRMFLADGFCRTKAARRVGVATLLADVRQGDVRDAILFSVGANAMHGVRRRRADMRKAVRTLLLDPDWSRWSNSKLADVVGCDGKTVGAIREEMEDKAEITAADRLLDRAGRSCPARRPAAATQELREYTIELVQVRDSGGLDSLPTLGEPLPVVAASDPAAAALAYGEANWARLGYSLSFSVTVRDGSGRATTHRINVVTAPRFIIESR